MDESRWDETTSLRTEVTVWGPQAAKSAWHTDPECPSLTRHKSNPISFETPRAQDVDSFLSSSGRYPCMACAFPALVDLWVRGGIENPSISDTRTVLACPLGRLAQNGSHHRCHRCRELAQIAERHDAPTCTDTSGYRLVALSGHETLSYPISRVYLVHRVPADVGEVTVDLLAIAWATANRNRSGLQVPAYRRDRHSAWNTEHKLNFVAAELVTAPAP